MNVRRTVVLALLTGLAVVAGVVGSTNVSAPTPTSSTSKLTGPLTVFAASSLTDAFKDAEATLEVLHTGYRGTYSFAGSQQLVAHIKDGAAADVVATADMTTMQTLITAGLVDTPQVFAHNTMEIAVAKGNPKHIGGLADLAKPGISVVLADPSVPAGNFARQALQQAGVRVVPRSNELDVKSAMEKVESGDADAAIVYYTDVVAASGTVDGVLITNTQNVVATYPIAVVRTTRHHDAAAAFVQDAVNGDIQAALRKRGFLAP